MAMHLIAAIFIFCFFGKLNQKLMEVHFFLSHILIVLKGLGDYFCKSFKVIGDLHGRNGKLKTGANNHDEELVSRPSLYNSSADMKRI